MDTAKLKKEIQAAEEALNKMKKELEDAEKMNSKDYYPESQEVPFSVDTILKVIGNKIYVPLLYTAFDWAKTPQGNAYWNERDAGRIHLSDEDKITLLRWCVNYYRNK